MKSERSICPKCQAEGISRWAFFAYWPFTARCKNCGVKVRAKIPGWQNVLVQVLGQIVFWGAVLFGITTGLGGLMLGILAGAILAALIAMVPGFFSTLESLPK